MGSSSSIDPAAPCACGSAASYARCCGALHAGAPAATAEALMRARYSAYAQRRAEYLLTTWHATTRPFALDLDGPENRAMHWLGLQVLAHTQDAADHARVEFVARFRIGGGSAQRLHEVSRFVREQGRWYYLDGEFPGAAA